MPHHGGKSRPQRRRRTRERARCWCARVATRCATTAASTAPMPSACSRTSTSSPAGARSVVLLLADASDFDGSFPRAVARLVAAAEEAHRKDWKHGAPANVPRAVLVVTKLDLLPTPSLSSDDVHAWAQSRARAGAGADLRFAGVHLVSAACGSGVRDLHDHVRELAGPRGNVWAVGSRNVGKSSLLNAIAQCSGDQP
jgi:ribosome biogenesis GTPase A